MEEQHILIQCTIWYNSTIIISIDINTSSLLESTQTRIRKWQTSYTAQFI